MTPRAALNFTNKLSYWDMLKIGNDLVAQQNIIKDAARRQALLNSSLDLTTILQNIQSNATALGIKPDWVHMLATSTFNQTYNSTEVIKIKYVDPLIKYLHKGYSDWISCERNTYCLFYQLNTPFRNSLKPHMGSDVLDHGSEFHTKFAFERLNHFTTITNPQHPIYALYNLTDSIISIQHAQNQTTTIKAACKEMLKITQKNITQKLALELNITFALQDLPDSYLQIGCEPERARFATELQQHGLPVKTALHITGRTSLLEVERLTYIFAGRLSYSLFSSSSHRGINFDELTDIHLQQIMYPVNKYKINLPIALELFSSGYNSGQDNLEHQFSHYHSVENTFKSCDPHVSRNVFAGGKELIGNITNYVLLTSLATMLTACMETRVAQQLKYTRAIKSDETHHEQQDALLFVEIALLTFTALGLCLKLMKSSCLSKSTIKFTLWGSQEEKYDEPKNNEEQHGLLAKFV